MPLARSPVVSFAQRARLPSLSFTPPPTPYEPSLSPFTVRPFTSNSAWTASRDLSSLTTREIEAYVSSPAKKSGDLLQAYKIARDPTEWQRQRDEAQAEYEELQARAMEFDTEDQLASAGEERASVGKKRKSEGGKSVASEGKKKKAKVEQAGKTKVSE